MRTERQAILPCHFGEWLQGRLGADGPVALVTLSPKGASVRAWHFPASTLSVRAVCHGRMEPATLARFRRRLPIELSGRILLRLPYPPGLGTGMSTAGLLAAAQFAARQIGPLELAQAWVGAEGASDPLMLASPSQVLWAPRTGKSITPMPPQPHAHLLAGFWGPARPTQAADQDYDDISDLVDLWKKEGSLASRAKIAAESARRCIARRGPIDDPTETLARDLGALGWTISHSGAARALVFAPGQVPPHGASALREAGLRGVHRLTASGV